MDKIDEAKRRKAVKKEGEPKWLSKIQRQEEKYNR